MNILLFLNKIKIVALSSAKVITKYAFFFFFTVYCLVLQRKGNLSGKQEMQKGYLLWFENIWDICIYRQKRCLCQHQISDR